MGEKQEHQARGPDIRERKWTARERQHGEPPKENKNKKENTEKVKK